MAHFARLNDNNSVVHIHVVDNENLLDENGVEQEAIGIQYLQNLYGGTFGTDKWIQCSYSNRIRKQYPGLGHVYLEDADVFIHPQPYASWTLDSNYDWQSPVAVPAFNIDTQYAEWDEVNTQWIVKDVQP